MIPHKLKSYKKQILGTNYEQIFSFSEQQYQLSKVRKFNLNITHTKVQMPLTSLP